MAGHMFDDRVRWGLVRPAGLVGLVETLVRGTIPTHAEARHE